MISVFDLFNVYALLVYVIVLLWCYSKHRTRYWRKLKVKYLEPLPFLNNTYKYQFRIKPRHETLSELYNQMGDEPFMGIYNMNEPVLLVRDPQLISTIFNSDFKYFQDRVPSILMPGRKLHPLGTHLATSSGERWSGLRYHLTSVFTPTKLKQMYEQMFEHVHTLTEHVEVQMKGTNTIDMDMQVIMERLTLDIIGSCAFGIECHSLKLNDKFKLMTKMIFEPRTLKAMINKLLKMVGFADGAKKLTDFFMRLTLEMVEYRRQNGVTKNDLLQHLMDLQNAHSDPKFAVDRESGTNVFKNEEFDEIDIAANTFLFFTVGFETIAATLSCCLYELALNQNIQHKLRAEVQRVKDEYPNLNYESLKEMPYMEAVITETLRKHTVGVLLIRTCTEEYVIPGTEIRLPVGTRIHFPAYSIHHDPRNYENPETFDPERFYADDKKLERHSGKFIPYGDGPRDCIGKGFANMEMKMALATFLSKYDFKPCSKTEIPLQFSKGYSLLHPKNGIWINVTKRNV